MPQFSCAFRHSSSKDCFMENRFQNHVTPFSVCSVCPVRTQLSISQLLWVLAVESFSKNCPQLKRTTSLKFILLSQGQPPFNNETKCGLDSWSQDWRTWGSTWPSTPHSIGRGLNSSHITIQILPGTILVSSPLTAVVPQQPFPFNHLWVNLRVCFLGKWNNYTTVSIIKKRERHPKLKST